MSARRPRVRYVVRDHGRWAPYECARRPKWVVFDMWERRQVATRDTRAKARSLAKVKNAEDRLKRALANAVQLEIEGTTAERRQVATRALANAVQLEIEGTTA